MRYTLSAKCQKSVSSTSTVVLNQKRGRGVPFSQLPAGGVLFQPVWASKQEPYFMQQVHHKQEQTEELARYGRFGVSE